MGSARPEGRVAALPCSSARAPTGHVNQAGARGENDHTHGARRKHGWNRQKREEHLYAEIASNEGTADDRPQD
jgi:hypothetical protein